MIVEIIIAEQEWYYYRYILIRSGTWWLYVCMVTLQPSASIFSIYIDVNGCTNGHMSIHTIEQSNIVALRSPLSISSYWVGWMEAVFMHGT